MVVERSLRPAPDAVAARFFSASAGGPRTAGSGVAEPSAQVDWDPTLPTPSGGVAAAPTPSRRGLCWWDPDEGNGAEPQVTGGHS